ncbi:MAG: MBOAT family protein, partial [Planctomycetes bacterium]|nr:MBOAT family protein [Planctomycetota bacterium]
YTIDIYRGDLRAHRSLLDFALFVAFFPQLVAGPILRASEFLPQITRPRVVDLRRVYEGGYLIFWGLFKKAVIADNLAVVVDRAFAADVSPAGGAVMVAVYAFAIQIYCDFSGYTDIARGCAKMMGFDICLNFNLPYFACNPVEFWRRWHISLSSWLRDYLYIPLGGNRRGPGRTCINLMVTMVLGGLWHGAAWTFVAWGAYQGVLLATYKASASLMKRIVPAVAASSIVSPWVARIVFFQFVSLGWLIFRAESLGQVGDMLGALFLPWSLRGTGVTTLVACTLPLLIVELAQHWKSDLDIVLRWPAPIRGLAYTAGFFGLLLFGDELAKPFIYFQF